MITEVVRVPMHQRYLHTLAAADGAESELSAVLRNFQNAFILQFITDFKRPRERVSPRQDLLTDPRHSLPLLLPLSQGRSTKEVRRRWVRMGGRPRSEPFGEVGSWRLEAHRPRFIVGGNLI